MLLMIMILAAPILPVLLMNLIANPAKSVENDAAAGIM
jgi:hypothetical protein